jgi:hypothetical protein
VFDRKTSSLISAVSFGYETGGNYCCCTKTAVLLWAGGSLPEYLEVTRITSSRPKGQYQQRAALLLLTPQCHRTGVVNQRSVRDPDSAVKTITITKNYCPNWICIKAGRGMTKNKIQSRPGKVKLIM